MLERFMNEIPVSWKLSAEFGVAVLWRALLLNLAVGIIVLGLKEAGFLSEGWALVLELAGSITGFFLATHWALMSGFGSVQIIFMERADYEKLKGVNTRPSI